jgi:REP element-mobilizing transposase RayT
MIHTARQLLSATSTPKANANGTDAFTFQVTDGTLTSNVATATVKPVNRVPVATAQRVTTTQKMEVMEDHVHLCLSAPPRYAPARVVQILKSISARELFARFPRLRRRLWGGQLWEDGYFVRSVGDAVTAEIIRRYIRYQKNPQNVQLRLFDEGS